MAQFNWNLRGTIPGPRWCSFECCFTLGEIRYPSNSQICFLHFHAMLKAKVITQQRPDPAHHKDIWPVWSLIWEVEAFPSIFWTPKGGMVEPPTWAHWAVALQAVMPFPRAIWGGEFQPNWALCSHFQRFIRDDTAKYPAPYLKRYSIFILRCTR